MTQVLSDDEAVRRVQTAMAAAGFYEGEIDGSWGGMTDGAFDVLLAAALAGRQAPTIPSDDDEPGSLTAIDPRLCWGAKVSRTFRDRVHWMVDDLGMPRDTGADDMMTCMAWESAETFSPSVKNAAGSGATGLIQFMPATALGFFHSAEAIKTMSDAQRRRAGLAATARLAALSAEDQLNYVYRYFRPFKGRLRNLGDLYMAILWPAGVGQPDSFVLWEKGKRPTTYRQNAGLDGNRDGAITRGECLAKLRAKRARGFEAGRVWSG